MEWPAYSPDLNPIENLWDILGRKVMERRPANRAQLVRILQDEWEELDQGLIRNLIQSMRKRCNECVEAHGGHIPY